MLIVGLISPTYALKLTPEVIAAQERIAARKQKADKEAALKQRNQRLLKGHQTTNTNQHIVSAEEALKRLETRAKHEHKVKLQADSGMVANSKMDVWLNSIMPEDPPDTIAPHMRIPDTVFDIETNTFKK
jgi:flagellar motility protein MotE (MotC chaperone)